MLKQNENNLFRDRQETVRCLWFLSCDDLVCDWLHHNKHSRHISGVHANMITAVNLVAFFSPFLLKDFILPCCYPKKPDIMADIFIWREAPKPKCLRGLVSPIKV